jgi:hypothetical protein
MLTRLCLLVGLGQLGSTEVLKLVDLSSLS